MAYEAVLSDSSAEGDHAPLPCEGERDPFQCRLSSPLFCTSRQELLLDAAQPTEHHGQHRFDAQPGPDDASRLSSILPKVIHYP